MRDGSHDFDYLAGAWTVQHRRLRRPLSGSDDWYSFDGTMAATLYWGGGANIDDNVLHLPDGSVNAFSIRLYDARTQQWSIYWATNANGLTTIPTVGAFDANGIGTFFNRETFLERPILVRYMWSGITINGCRWEQSYSTDDGTTWEPNWRMDFARASVQ